MGKGAGSSSGNRMLTLEWLNALGKKGYLFRV